jgi:hypothetical protein
MCRCKKRPVKGSWHRAQGKASVQADGINDPFRAPFADYTYVAVTCPVESAGPSREARIQQEGDGRNAVPQIPLRRGHEGFPTDS